MFILSWALPLCNEGILTAIESYWPCVTVHTRQWARRDYFHSLGGACQSRILSDTAKRAHPQANPFSL